MSSSKDSATMVWQNVPGAGRVAAVDFTTLLNTATKVPDDTPQFSRSAMHTHERDGYANESFSYAATTGTHTRFEGGVALLVPEQLTGRSVPLRPETAEKDLGDIGEGSIVVIPIATSGDGPVSLDTAFGDQLEAVVSELPKKKVLGVVTNAASFMSPPGNLQDTKLEQILFDAGAFVVFNAELPDDSLKDLHMCVMPLRFGEGLVAVPTRVVGLTSDTGSIPQLLQHTECTQLVTRDSPFFPGGGQPFMGCPFHRHRQAAAPGSDVLLKHGNDIGTHVDSPSHFYAGARSITDLKLSELIVPLFVIDVSDKVRTDDDYEATVEDLKEWEKVNGELNCSEAFVCVRTGWAARFEASDLSYLNKDSGGTMHFPGFSAALAKELLSRGVAGIGIDTLSLDPGRSEEFPVHQIMLGASKYQVENMILDGAPAKGFHMATLPLKVEGAFEANARCVAFKLSTV